MLSKISLVFGGALTLLPHLAFSAVKVSAGSVELPSADIESICRDARSETVPEMRSSAYQACVRDERSAFEQLRQGWGHYPADARLTCMEAGDVVPLSYVELQTCLEMQPGGNLAVGVP